MLKQTKMYHLVNKKHSLLQTKYLKNEKLILKALVMCKLHLKIPLHK